MVKPVATFDTFVQLIDAWPSLRVFAGDVGVPYVTAQMMKFRDSINARHWPAIVEAAGRRKISGVTLVALMELGRKRDARRPTGGPNPKRPLGSGAAA